MSRPYQFADREERITSPLDRRQQNPYPAGQQPNFTTNVNRAKTKKWVEAKAPSYGGDDWDDYDEDDEYGVQSAQEQHPPPLPAGVKQLSNARSFTNPVSSSQGSHEHRRNSFDQGDEKRAFSAAAYPQGVHGQTASQAQQIHSGPPRSPVPLYVETSVGQGKSQASDSPSNYDENSGTRLASAASFATSEISSATPEHRRDFSPSAMPTPLRAVGASIPGSATSVNAPFPPRKTSMSQQRTASGSQPAPVTATSRESTPVSPDKPLPIIRPADIYKRVPEERERERRQSLESNRSQELASPVGMDSPGRAFGRNPGLDRFDEGPNRQLRAPLETVAERKSEYGLPGIPDPQTEKQSTTSPTSAAGGPSNSFSGLSLPQIGGESGFGDDFWSSTVGESTGKDTPLTSPASGAGQGVATHDAALQHQPSVGFRSMVHQAFDEPAVSSNQGSVRSIGATDSSVSRSNTTGTSDISPIMSRVPSSATGAAGSKAPEHRDATPMIAEEPEPADRKSRSSSIENAQQIARKPSPVRSRNPSEGSIPTKVTPGYRRDLNTPSPNNSPARSPVLESNKQLPSPGVAEVAVGSPLAKSMAHTATLPLNAGTREADIVDSIASSPEKEVASLVNAQKLAQESFLETNKPEMLPSTSSKIARSESPSKGRVADLAGRFNEVSDSRRSSVQSLGSKKSSSSVRSREETLHPSGAAGDQSSTLKPLPTERPTAERDISFRPKLPGGFESYNSVSDAPVPTAPDEVKAVSGPTGQGGLNEIDLTPTSAKQQVQGKDLGDSHGPSIGPMAALAAAGAAMGDALRKSLGSDENSPDSPKSVSRLHGEVFQRPLAPDRMESTVSTIPPTPPAKDEHSHEYVPPPVPLKERSKSPEHEASTLTPPSRPTVATQLSTDTGPTDFESDRLRREIVRSLSPVDDSRVNASTEEVIGNRAPNRTSNAIPSEYDSYWFSGDDDKEVAPAEHSIEEQPEPLAVTQSSTAKPPPTTVEAPAPLTSLSGTKSPDGPGFLAKRFSWEKSQSKPSSSVLASPGTGIVKSPANMQPPLDPLSLNPKLSGEPLHIVNAEPGELPTPVEPVTRTSLESPIPTATEAISPIVAEDTTSPVRETPLGPRPQANLRPTTGEEPRPASFREILAIKSTPARIAKYEETRQQFAKTNTGLDDWLTKTLAANPQHRDVATIAHRPTMPGGGVPGPRHKATSSITRVFTKTESPAGQSQPPHLDTGFSEYQGKSSPASASEQRISALKGKDLLNKAGVLGGKGMKEAKGLFAKGKSRFRGSGTEKADERSTSPSQSPSTPSPSSMRSQDYRPSSRRSSRSFSPFRRPPRPNSVIVPNHADYIPNIPDQLLPPNTRPQSYPAVHMQPWPEPENIFRLSRRAATDPELQPPLTPPYTAKRLGILPSPITTTSARDSSGNNPTANQSDDVIESDISHISPIFSSVAEEEQTPRERFSFEIGEAPLTPRTPNRINNHQRVVSLIQPEDIVPNDDEPVSPISPEDEDDTFPEEPRLEGQAISASSNPASHAPSTKETSIRSLKPGYEDHHSINRSRASIDTWDKESEPEPPANAGASVHESSPEVTISKSGEPKGKEKLDSLSTNPETEPPSSMHSRDASSIHSAVIEQAQAINFKRHTGTFGPETGTLTPKNRFKDPSDRLSAIAEAHRRMRQQFDEEDAARNTPHDFAVVDSAAKKFDSDRVSIYNDGKDGDRLTVPGQQGTRSNNRTRLNSMASTKTVPAGPTMIVTSPESEFPPRSKSLGAHANENIENLVSSLSITARSMPSVSSLGPDTDPSAEQSPVGQHPAVSPIKSAFDTRDYRPPNPDMERPMSFIPLRDSTGGLVQETISTSKHPIKPEDVEEQPKAQSKELPKEQPQEQPKELVKEQPNEHLSQNPKEQLEEQPQETSPTTSPGRLRRRSRQVSLPKGTAQDARQRRRSGQRESIEREEPHQPIVTPATPVTPVTPSKSQHRPVQLYDRPFDTPNQSQDERDQYFQPEMIGPRQQEPASSRPIIGPLPVDPPGGRSTKKSGVLQKLKGKATPTPATSASGPRQYIPPPEIQRLQSIQSQSSASGSLDVPGDKDKKKRGSGFFAGFKRPPSSGGDSNFTTVSGEASSVRAQANDSPTRPQYLQTPGALVGSIPPVPQDMPIQPGSKSKSKQQMPQRAITHTGQDPSKKKRFSALGSLFGRSGTTGHTPNSVKKLSKEQPKGTIFHRVPENPHSPPHVSAFEAQQLYQQAQWQALTQRQAGHSFAGSPDQVGGIPPPPGGYYAPGHARQSSGSFGHGAGAAGFAAISQQDRNTSASSAVSSNAQDKRSGSNASGSHRWPFGRNSSTESSTLLSPQVSANSPLDPYGRHNSVGGTSISPVSSRRDSSPGQPYGRPPRGFRMGSISEAQHQERPWALTLPGADDDDREVTNQEIMRAASARWFRGADGQMYSVPAEAFSTPTSPYVGSPTPTSPQPPPQAQGSPANPVYSYLPTQVQPTSPTQSSSRPPSSHHQQLYQSSHPASPQSAQAQYQQQIYHQGSGNSSPTGSTPGAPIIPPLPQPNIALVQPTPRRTSTGSPIAASSTRSQGAGTGRSQSLVQDPRQSPSYRSHGGGATAHRPSTSVGTGANHTILGAAPTPASRPAKPILPGLATTSSVAIHQSPVAHSASVSSVYSTTPSIARQTQPPQPPLSNPYTAPPNSPIATRSNHSRSRPSTSTNATIEQRPAVPAKDTPPPSATAVQNPGEVLGAGSMAAALSGRPNHRRIGSVESDEEVVMKAVSYPGDEWMPRFDID